jgi:group I intron endonuclease
MSEYIEGRIYCVVNTANDLKYVGSTTMSLGDRFNAHKSSTKRKARKLHNAMREIGVEKFKIELIEECCVLTKDDLRLKEKEHILRLNTIEKGYNLYLPARTKEERQIQKQIASKEYRAMKGDELLEKKKEYYQRNKERCKQNAKASHERNKEQRQEYMKKYAEKNKEILREYRKTYYQSNK